MFKVSDTKKGFLKSLFGNFRKGPHGLRYWLLPGSKIDEADLNMLLSFDFKKPQPDKITTIFKGNSKKRTRVMRFESNGTSFVTKIFRPYCARKIFRNHLTHKRYVFSELKNCVQAARLGISTPKMYAYFEQTILGFVYQSGIIMEDLYDHTRLTNLLVAGKRTIFDCLPVFKEFFFKGIYHMDTNTRNLLFRESDSHFTIIDWQESKFYPRLNDSQLCAMVAKMFFSAGISQEDPQWRLWIQALYEECRPGISLEEMLNAVQILQSKRIPTAFRNNPDISQSALEAYISTN
ncbi:MAG: 3-deoxy-D-manno-octulosonic-acid kinase [Planctomycetes bacterium ADurb.Bin401]|nr:MAG: 3-deoxy-D-manno-octulosonic-acid kinase [Planctomycetes bacterium ADurb.Bin401]